MKKIKLILTIILLAVATGCKREKQPTDDIIIVDVTKSYSPKKELILQDILDVEYIVLETNDEFICQGIVLAVGKQIILVRNRVDDGNIFVYDRNGKGLRTINRKGQSSEDYFHPTEAILDEDNDEIIVNDFIGGKIVIYDLYGNFKRNFKNDDPRYRGLFKIDRDKFICFDRFIDDKFYAGEQSYHAVISKEDRSIISEIQIPFKEKIETTAQFRDGNTRWTELIVYNPIIPFHGNWILTLPSSDTIYTYTTDNRLLPFIARTPTIQYMDPAVFLFPQILTEQYYFLQKVKKFDLKSFADRAYENTQLLFDRKENTIHECTIYNDDYLNNKVVDLSQQKLIGDDMAAWNIIEAYALVEDYEKGNLKGKLQEIASKLDEEDNPVIMLLKHKKKLLNSR